MIATILVSVAVGGGVGGAWMVLQGDRQKSCVTSACHQKAPSAADAASATPKSRTSTPAKPK